VENQTAGKIRFGNNLNNHALLDKDDEKTPDGNDGGMNISFEMVKNKLFTTAHLAKLSGDYLKELTCSIRFFWQMLIIIRLKSTIILQDYYNR
jgi:hypothetical protein